MRPRRDSNPQSSDPKSDALSIRPRGRRKRNLTTNSFYFTLLSNISQLSHDVNVTIECHLIRYLATKRIFINDHRWSILHAEILLCKVTRHNQIDQLTLVSVSKHSDVFMWAELKLEAERFKYDSSDRFTNTSYEVC